MPHTTPARLTVAVVATGLVVVAFAAGGGMAGHWRLVEQTYEAGGQNLAPRSEDHHLRVDVAPARATVTTWTGDDPGRAVPWPAAVVDGVPLDPERVDRRVDVTAGRLEGSLRIAPANPGDLALELEESYAFDPATDTLVGTVTVRMFRDGAPRGGYVLHRRYERVR